MRSHRAAVEARFLHKSKQLRAIVKSAINLINNRIYHGFSQTAMRSQNYILALITLPTLFIPHPLLAAPVKSPDSSAICTKENDSGGLATPIPIPPLRPLALRSFALPSSPE